MSKYNQEHLAGLEALGFKEYDGYNDLHCSHDIDVEEGQMLFIEEEFHRRRIFVKLYEDDEYRHNYFEVYVLEDVGCGTICMPFAWCDIGAVWLTHLKFSLCLNGFKKDGKCISLEQAYKIDDI